MWPIPDWRKWRAIFENTVPPPGVQYASKLQQLFGSDRKLLLVTYMIPLNASTELDG
jgi:hypothetical protein